MLYQYRAGDKSRAQDSVVVSQSTETFGSREGQTNSGSVERPNMLFVMFVASILGLWTLVYASPAEAVTCTGKQVYPSQNLSNVAKNNSAGTTFCVNDGTYNISSPVVVQSGDKFIGVYSDRSRPQVKTTQAWHVLDARRSKNATIRGLRVSGAVGNNQCEPNCGRGIGGGTNLTVDNVRADGNKNQGIGGSGPGLLVTRSEIDHNGSYAFTSLDGGTNYAAAGIKSVNSMTVLNSYVHDNYWSGVWCDNDCDAFEVKGSTLTNNGKSGIHYEASNGPTVLANNKIQNNGINDAVPGRRAGLIIYAGSNVDVYGNTFGANTSYGIWPAEDDRDWTLPMLNVSIHGNIMNGNTIRGCDLLSVTCINNK